MIKITGDENDPRVRGALAWARSVVFQFAKEHAGLLEDLTPHNLYHLIEMALVAGFLSKRHAKNQEADHRDEKSDLAH